MSELFEMMCYSSYIWNILTLTSVISGHVYESEKSCVLKQWLERNPCRQLSNRCHGYPAITILYNCFFLLAGEFKECTILFSDVVTFTNICAQCEPIQIVLMLNSMYLQFDRLTTVHDVYKVCCWLIKTIEIVWNQAVLFCFV